MKTYLYAVQDDNGRELLAIEAEVEKVSEVKAAFDGGDIVLLKGKTEITRAAADDSKTWTLHRWPADDKLSAPVSHRVS